MGWLSGVIQSSSSYSQGFVTFSSGTFPLQNSSLTAPAGVYSDPACFLLSAKLPAPPASSKCHRRPLPKEISHLTARGTESSYLK